MKGRESYNTRDKPERDRNGEAANAGSNGGERLINSSFGIEERKTRISWVYDLNEHVDRIEEKEKVELEEKIRSAQIEVLNLKLAENGIEKEKIEIEEEINRSAKIKDLNYKLKPTIERSI